MDYTVACGTAEAARPVDLRIAAPEGVAVAVAGRPPQTGTFSATVDLNPGQGLQWVVIDGFGSATTYHARCIPPDFPAFAVTRNGTPQAQWYIVTPSLNIGDGPPGSPYAVIFNGDGVPVWWYRSRDQYPIDAALLANGNLAWANWGLSSFGSVGGFDEFSLDGRKLRTYETGGGQTDFHDMRLLPNGHVLLLTYKPRSGVDVSQIVPGATSATVLDAEIQEIDPSNGSVVWSWNSKDHIALDETVSRWRATLLEPYDIIHLNSIEDDGDGLIISARHLDAIYRINKATGAIQWKLGGTHRPESLVVRGDPNGDAPLGGQHDARRLPDGTVSVYDNATALDRPPRAVRYRVDPAAGTATLLEQVSDPSDVPDSPCCGSARKLSGGDWVISWGGRPLVEELNSSGRRVLALHFDGMLFSYRADALEPGRLSTNDLRSAMDAQANNLG
jgi:hypothetical protein